MSVLRPPGAKREPLAKSLPASSTSTKRVISAGSLEASASSITMISPRAAANPHAKALPFPRPLWRITRTSARMARATSIVSSTECPSTSTTSSTELGRRASTWGRFAASFSVGITTLIVAPPPFASRSPARRPAVRRPRRGCRSGPACLRYGQPPPPPGRATTEAIVASSVAASRFVSQAPSGVRRF